MVSKIEWLGIGAFGSMVVLGWVASCTETGAGSPRRPELTVAQQPVVTPSSESQLKPFNGVLDPVGAPASQGNFFDEPSESGYMDGEQGDQIRVKQDQSWQARVAARETEDRARLDRFTESYAEQERATAARRAQRDAQYSTSVYDNDPSPPSRSEWDEEQASIAVVPRRAEPPTTYRGYDGRNMDRAIDVGNGYVKDRNTGIVRPTLDMGNGVRQEVRRPIDAMNDAQRDFDND